MIYTYIYIYIYVCMYIYIYIHIYILTKNPFLSIYTYISLSEGGGAPAVANPRKVHQFLNAPRLHVEKHVRVPLPSEEGTTLEDFHLKVLSLILKTVDLKATARIWPRLHYMRRRRLG